MSRLARILQDEEYRHHYARYLQFKHRKIPQKLLAELAIEQIQDIQREMRKPRVRVKRMDFERIRSKFDRKCA